MSLLSRLNFTLAAGLALSTSAAYAAEDEGLPLDEVLELEDLDLDALLGLEVVTVTAQKRVEDLQDVPASVFALSGENVSLLRTSGQDIRFLSAKVPSLYIESSFGRTFPRLYLRGLGNPDFDLNASQPVSVLLDGVVLENPTLKGFPLFDMDRVEVLRGPQGTLFGRNTPAGIVKLETRRPTNEYELFFRGSYGSFDFTGIELAGNVPVIEDVLAVRISGLFERRSNWVNNSFEGGRDLDGFDDIAARAQLLFTPGEDFQALLNVHVRRLDGSSRVFHANAIAPGSEDFADGYARDQVSQDGVNKQELTQIGFGGQLSYDFGEVTLTSITGVETMDLFSRGDVDGGSGDQVPFASESADAIPSLLQITEELRVSSNGWDVFNFQAGVFVFREEQTIDSYNYFEGAESGFATQTQETTAWAVFASAWVDVIDHLRLTGGIRYSNDTKDFRAERVEVPFPGIVPFSGSTTLDADYVSWDASVIYEVVKDVSLYARASSSFRAPSFQGRVLFSPADNFDDAVSTARAEDILSFEGGVKSQFWGDRVRANMTGYFFIMNDQQLTAVGGEGNANALLNADETQGYGAELDVALAPIRGLRMGLGLSYNHTQINDPDLFVAPCAGGCTVLSPENPANPATVSIDGNSLPNAPEWIANANVRYDLRLDADHGLYAFTNWSYRSRVHFFLYRSTEFTDAEALIGDLRLGYRLKDGLLDASFFVANLLNDESLTGAIDFNNLTGFVNDPLTVGLELRVQL